MIEELRLVTERKFLAKRKFLDRFFMELPFELVYTPKEPDLNEFPEMRDVKDSPILATAIMEGIDVFLTGDKDFLVLDVETPEILTMKVRVANPMHPDAVTSGCDRGCSTTS